MHLLLSGFHFLHLSYSAPFLIPLFPIFSILVKNIADWLRSLQILALFVDVGFERSWSVSCQAFLSLTESRNWPFFVVKAFVDRGSRSFCSFQNLLGFFVYLWPGVQNALLLFILHLLEFLKHSLPLLLPLLLVLDKLLRLPRDALFSGLRSLRLKSTANKIFRTIHLLQILNLSDSLLLLNVHPFCELPDIMLRSSSGALPLPWVPEYFLLDHPIVSLFEVIGELGGQGLVHPRDVLSISLKVFFIIR